MLAPHNANIIDQFTKQAAPFADKQSSWDPAVFDLLVQFSRVTPRDTVLDIACGPGLVSIAFAKSAAHVTGIDLTPAMIQKAKSLQHQAALANLTFQTADASNLPFPNDHYSMVITRYSFHHFENPRAVLQEMVRVCKPGGTVLFADVAPPPEKAEAFDRFEKLRDPSHVHAFGLQELKEMASNAGLTEIRSTEYALEMDFESQLAASFPNPGDQTTLRQLVEADITKNDLGLSARLQDGKIRLSYPSAVVAGRKL